MDQKTMCPYCSARDSYQCRNIGIPNQLYPKNEPLIFEEIFCSVCKKTIAITKNPGD